MNRNDGGRGRPHRKQSGLALLLVIGVLGLGAIFMLVRSFKEASLSTPKHLGNLRVLDDARAALLIYVSSQVATEDYPGKLPCPEDTTKIGTANEGRAQSYCSLPAVGRLPWKTLGYAVAPLDLDGEQLWYAVSPGFNRASSGASLVINSNTPAGLSVDGSTARAVALIFAPGRPLSGQTRTTVTSANPPSAANYLDGENATLDTSFATYGPANAFGTTFNDQVAIVTHQDLFDVVEPAVARRLSDTMVTGTKPLTSIYASASWGTSGSAPVFPYGVPFGNPDSSTFQGSAGTTQGLLPVTFSTTPGDATQYCNPVTDGTRCNPTFVKWASFQSISKSSGSMTLYDWPAATCSVADASLSCTIYTNNSGTLTISLAAKASNVAMALRQLDSDAPSVSDFSSTGRSASATINSDGSSTITFTGKVVSPGSSGSSCFTFSPFTFQSCYKRTFTIPIRIFADHPIVNSQDSEYGWFTRNDWHKLTYFAIAPAFAASGTHACSAPSCLTISNLGTTPVDNKRAILILAGRAIGTQTHPSANLSDYLESENLSPVDTTFTTLKPSMAFNDRIVIVDTN